MHKYCSLFYFGLIFLGIAGHWSCQTSIVTENQDPVLAQVYNKTLVLSDIAEIIQNPESEDSLHQLQSFVNRWVAEAILMHEAEKHVLQNMDVDKLVRDYRSSLILNNYEQVLFAKELNVVITDADIRAYYTSHKEQFRLSYDIVRYSFAKAPNTIDLTIFEKWWDLGKVKPSEDFVQFLSKNTVYFDLKMDQWSSLQDFKKKLPKNLAQSLSIETDVLLENNNYLYFLKIYEIGKKGDFAPISFVRDQVEKIILHGRKMKLLEDKKATLYQNEIKGGNVKVFTN